MLAKMVVGSLRRVLLVLLVGGAVLPAAATAACSPVDGYTGPGPAVVSATDASAPPPSAAGATRGQAAPCHANTSTSILPFTGLQVGLLLLVGLSLLGLGVGLRRFGDQGPLAG